MDTKKHDQEKDKETEASKRRAKRLKEIQEGLENGQDDEMAKILAEIEANNKK